MEGVVGMMCLFRLDVIVVVGIMVVRLSRFAL